MNNLLEKIESVEVSTSSKFPNNLVQYAKQKQNFYDKHHQSLMDWKALLTQGINTIPQPETRNDDFYYQRYKADEEIEKINKLLKETKGRFLSDVVCEINKAFNLQLSIQPEDIGECTTDAIFSKVDELIGGVSLDDATYQSLKEQIHKKVYWFENVSKTRKSIGFSNYVTYKDSFRGLNWGWDDEKDIDVLVSMCQYFETKSVFGGIYPWSYQSQNRIPPIGDVIDINLSKIEGLKFFKNRKVEIRFKDGQTCKDFYEFWGLGEIKNK